MKKLLLEPAFSDAELSIIQLFRNKKISDSDSVEIKAILAKYFMDKARNAADKAWDEKGYTNDTIDKLLQSDK